MHPDCWPTFKIATFFSHNGWAAEQHRAYTLCGLCVSAETLVLGQQVPLCKPHTVLTGIDVLPIATKTGTWKAAIAWSPEFYCGQAQSEGKSSSPHSS